MKKRLLTVLLAVLMIVSLLPSMVFASEVGCTRTQKVTTITDGETYQMNLSGKNKGDFTFEASGKNWNIKNSDGRYLNAADGKLVLEGAAETAWTYSKGAFSISEKTTQKNNGYWWGWMWIPGWSSKTVTTTYYLSTVTNGAKLSTSCVSAELYKTVSGDHDYDKAVYVDKTNHKYVCRYCGDVKTEAHSYDGTTHKCVCGAYDPAESSVKISVDVKEKTSRQYIGWWPWGYYKTVTTYTAAIKAEAKGVKVTKVQYQLNGGRWMTGTCVTSEKPIESLKVKAWDSNGKLYEYEWPEEVEKQTALYTYVYENKEPYDYIKDATVTFVTGEAESRTFTGETDAYGFAAINVPRNVEGTLTISKDGYVTKTKENVTYPEATAEEKFWLDIAKSEIRITLAVSGEGAGHFEDVWAPGAAIDSVEFESGKYFSDNENGYFYIADDASGTGVHPYQFVADEGSGFAGFDPNKATYEAITTGFTLTANAEKTHTVTFHAGTADEIIKGAMITGSAGKWNVAADSRSAYRSYRTSELDEGAIKAEGSASVEAVYEGYSITSWTKAASTWDYYPAWKANSYNVTAQVQGDHGTATVKVNDVEVSSAAYASNVVFSATPNAGYEFDHWEVVSGGIDIESVKNNAEINVTMPDTALTLKAHFKAIVPAEYGIIVEADGHGTAKAQVNGIDVTSAAPGTIVTLVAAPDDGFQLKDWQDQRGSMRVSRTNTFKMPESEVKMKAIFQRVYTIEVVAQGHGTASADAQKSITGIEITLTAKPDAGYKLDQWVVERGGVTVGDNDKFFVGTEDVKIKAVFAAVTPDTYNIIVEDDGHGTASANPTSAAPGATVTLTATPNDGYAFEKWEIARGLESITGNSFTMPSNEVKVKAIFERVYNITLQTNEHGKASATVGGETATTAAENAEVTLTANPAEGYKLKEWKVVSGDIAFSDEDKVKSKLDFNMPASNITIMSVFDEVKEIPDYLCFTADGVDSSVCMTKVEYEPGTLPDVSLLYSIDETSWNEYTIGDSIDLKSGEKVLLKASESNSTYSVGEDYYRFGMTGSIAASGNIMSLLDSTCESTKISSPGCFQFLFEGCDGLTSAPDLPATELSIGCYVGMFNGCTNLKEAPELPAESLKMQCYANMFSGCESLQNAPELSAENLEIMCYSFMFSGCTNLTESPVLPAKILAEGCYCGMFDSCSNLSTITMLAEDISDDDCLVGWVYDVASTGTFIKSPNMATGSEVGQLPSGENGIPTGWTVEDYESSAIETVADVLATVENDFPKMADELDEPADGWWEATGEGWTKECYLTLDDNYLRFYFNKDCKDISKNASVSQDSDNYVYTDGTVTITFNMTVGVLSSIEFADTATDTWDGEYSPQSECIAAGTMISMPGGKQKTVEELEIGDIICTFDHETGEVSSAPVCFIWESKNVGNAFTLTFEGDIEVTVIEEHGFYDQEEQKYVFINLQNAEEYIGHHFYNADTNSWLGLKSCKVSNERVDAYAIITSGHLNHMSNGMLSMCDGTVKMIANIFEYDDRMRYDADKKKADIETYGLTPIEKILEFDGFIEADYVDYNLQYLNVAVGKGLTTWERIKALSDYCVANGLVCIEQTNDVPMLGTEEKEPIIKALAPRSKPESCEPEKLEEAMPEELIEPAEAVAEEAAP